MLPALLILLIFAVAVALMVTRRLPALLALPFMAVAIGLVAGFSSSAMTPADVQTLVFETILTAGAAKLAGFMVTAMFGAILSQVVMRQGIAQQFVRLAAEYAGGSRVTMALVLYAVVAFNFSALSGLGAVIMMGSLILPVLVSSGCSPLYAATLMLLGISTGGMLNPVNWKVYNELLGIPEERVSFLAVQLAGIMALVSTAYLLWQGKRQGRTFAWAAELEETDFRPPVPLLALLIPVLPPLIMRIWHWKDVPAFLFAILLGCFAVQPRRWVSTLTASTLEGIKDVSPVLALFMGIGMTLNATSAPATSQILGPLMTGVLPSSPLGYVLFFFLLAPLALYRGPFNVTGLGAGLMALMATSGKLPALAVMAAFMCVGQVQSACDPTNTHNVWIAQFVKESPDRILRHTLPYLMGFVLLGLLAMTLGARVMA